MQAFLVALITSAGFASFLSSLGLMGSCFEGSCGYMAMLVSIPLTLITFPIWRRVVKRWAKGLQILIWLPVVFLISMLFFNSLIIVFGSALAVLIWFAKEAMHIRNQHLPWKALFIQPQPAEGVALS